MQSKRYSFSINRAILKKNMKTFWPVSLIYLIYLLLYVTLRVNMTITEYSRYTTMGDSVDSAKVLENRTAAVRALFSSLTEPVTVMIVAVMAVLCTFGYLYKNRKGYMMHSFPVTKSILFTTNVLSAFMILLVPQVITFVVTTGMTLACGINLTGYFAMWLAFEILYSIFFVGFATFIAMFTGQAWVVGLFYICFNGVYFWTTLIWYLIRELVSGDLIMSDVSDPNMVTVLTPVVYLLEKTGFTYENIYARYDDIGKEYVKSAPFGVSTALIYAGVGCLFIIAAYLIYEYRANERGGDFLSIPVTKPVFKFCAGFFGGCAIGVFLTYIFVGGETRLPLMVGLVVIFVFLFYCVAEVFVRKTFRIFNMKFFAEAAVGVACVCAIITYARVSAIQASKYIPEPSRVVMAGVGGDYIIATQDDNELKQKVLEMNRFVVEHYDELMKQMKESREMAGFNIEDWDYYNVEIRFETDNGKSYDKDIWYYCEKNDTQSAGYRLAAMNKNLHDNPESFKRYLFTNAYDELELDRIIYCDSGYYDDVYGIADYDGDGIYSDGIDKVDLMAYAISYISASRDLRQKFYRAILSDIDSGHVPYEQYPDEVTYQMELQFTSNSTNICSTSQLFWGNILLTKDYNVNIYLTEDYTNTGKFIEDVIEGVY